MKDKINRGYRGHEMLSKDLIERHTFALQVIGCKVCTYGHFDEYEIPGENDHGLQIILSEGNLDYFLSMVKNHFTSRSSLNKDYGDDLKEQNAVKSFIKAKAKRNPQECLSKGLEWVNLRLAG